MFFLVVAFLELLDQVEDHLDLSLLLLALIGDHVALDWLELRELKDELGKV